MDEKADQYLVPGLMRGLAVLQLFDDHNKELSMADIAAKMGLNRSSIFRLVYTLEYDGFLKRIASSNRYRLGARVLDLGYRFLSGLDLLEPAKPVLSALCDKTEMTAHLIIREGTDIVYVDRCQAKTPFTSTVGIGTRFPAYATTPGQLQLLNLSEQALFDLFANTQFNAYTERTPTSVEELMVRLNELRDADSVVSWGLFDKRIATCTAPIRGRDRKVVAVVSVSCPIGAIEQSILESKIRCEVESAAVELSKTLGWLR